MKIKPEEQRIAMLEYLKSSATLDELAQACADVVARKTSYANEYKRLSPFIEVPGKVIESASTTVKVAAEPVTETKPEGKEPPGKAAGRIGAKSLAEIKVALSRGPLTPRDINAAINGKSDNTNSLLKLLWVRGVVSWDGMQYSLKG